MRKQYSCDLLLGASESSQVPTPEEFYRVCHRWLCRPGRAGVERLEALPEKLDFVNDRKVFEIGDGAQVAALSTSDDAYRCLGVRLTHPDSQDSASAWTTDICFTHSLSSGDAKASVTTNVARTSGVIRPMHVQPSRPNIVRTIVETWEAREEIPVLPTSHRLDVGDVDEFLNLIKSPTRRIPVLFISARNFDDKPIVNADAVADQLVGLCHVFEATNRFPSLTLRDHLGRSLNCWDGAVRIYWPGFTLTDDPFWHKLWTPNRVEYLEESSNGFAKYILGFVSRVATARQTQTDVSWAFIEGRLHQMAMAEFRKAGDVDRLFDQATAQIEELKRQKEDLEFQLLESREEHERAKNEAETYKQAWIDAKKDAAKKPTDASVSEVLPPTSVEEVVERIEQEFPNQIVLALNGRSEVRDNPFEDCESLYKAFRFLAITFYRAKTGEEHCTNLDAACREASGFFYEPHQSKVTAGMFSDYYTTNWNGRKIELCNHIGKGTSKDARYCIRVSFEFIDDERIVVIGYIGQHQRTRAT